MGRISIIFNLERCKGCGLCIPFCHKSLLRPSDVINSIGYHPAESIDKAECTGCASCAKMCPDMAIEIVEEV